MIINFYLKVVLNQELFFFKAIVYFGFKLKSKHLKGFDSFVNYLLLSWIDYLKEILLKETFCLSLFNKYDISDDERVLLDFHPNIVTELATPDKV